MRVLSSMIALVFFACIALNAQADDKQTWREKLETAIPEGIRMLEAKEYVPFIKAMVEPDQLAKLTENGTVEEFAERFAKRKAADLLKVLKDIKGRTPSMEENGTVASYEVNVEGFSKKAIKFRKVDKYWYIVN
ncbi:MAG: hypothetical protein U0796_13925 [Gemmatales bacterium]